jgi:hypothetical protein
VKNILLLWWLCTIGGDCVSLDSSFVLLRGCIDVSVLGGPSPRLGCRPKDIGYNYHKGALVVNGPRHSPSLIMTRNNMDLRCLK